MTTGLPSFGGTCQAMTFVPSAERSITSAACGNPASAGAMRAVSGKYISARCATYMIATQAEIAGKRDDEDGFERGHDYF